MKKIFKLGVSMFVAMTLLTTITGTVFAATTNVISGQVQITNSAGTVSYVEDIYTTTVTSTSSWSTKTNNVTILNNSGARAEISFNYKADGYSSFSIGGSSSVSPSGPYSVTLDNGGNVKIVIKAKNSTATLTLTDISCTAIASEIDVSIKYDSSLGTVTKDGANVETGETIKIGETDVSLTATPVNGAEFIGWVDENGNIRSQNATFEPDTDKFTTLKALFYKNSEPFFMVDDKYIFDNLNDVATCSGTKIVLMRDAILPAGNYTIPAGKTLLIPFDDANTMYTDSPTGVNDGAKLSWGKQESYQTPVAYRTLTMQEGANITVNGTINLSAKHYAGDTQPNSKGGAPTGNVSFIKMSKNSSITVNNGGKLYAWGYITGDGNVIAESGAEVYEYFQFADFRGGSQTSLMAEGDQKSYGVFPLSQYYVQNIEVPLTIKAGAVETTFTSIVVSYMVHGSAVSFFGDGVNNEGMFNLESGYVTKRYDGTRDRLIVDLNGKMSVDPLDVGIGGISMNSSAYELPINNNITINVKEGSEIIINQNINLLPGAEIVIDEGAVGKLKSGVKAYVYDADEWGTYCSSKNAKFCPIIYAPSRTKTRTEADLVDGAVILNGTFDASGAYVYTTQNGANIYSEGAGKIKMQPGLDTITYQVIQRDPQKNSEYIPISVTTAKLKNSDGAYVEHDGKHIEFNYSDGVWNPKHAEVAVEAVAPTCTEDGMTDGIKCSLCDGWIKEQTTVSASGHTYVDYICGCGKKKIITKTEHSIDGENITITPTIAENDDLAKVIMIAVYDSSKKLLDSKTFLKEELDSVTFSNKDVNKIKVFSWSGYNTLEPIALVEEVSIQQ